MQWCLDWDLHKSCDCNWNILCIFFLLFFSSDELYVIFSFSHINPTLLCIFMNILRNFSLLSAFFSVCIREIPLSFRMRTHIHSHNRIDPFTFRPLSPLPLPIPPCTLSCVTYFHHFIAIVFLSTKPHKYFACAICAWICVTSTRKRILIKSCEKKETHTRAKKRFIVSDYEREQKWAKIYGIFKIDTCFSVAQYVTISVLVLFSSRAIAGLPWIKSEFYSSHLRSRRVASRTRTRTILQI